MTIAETDHRAQLIEAGFALLPDTAQIYVEWHRLMVIYSVMGSKFMMRAWWLRCMSIK